MVYNYTSNVVDPPATLYMGKHKEENEELIKYGREGDIWFHVDNLSSAHVYLRPRLERGDSFESLPQALLDDLGQLTKANSIEGNKINNVTVVYTPWSNLKKIRGMEVGQVSFHKPNLVKKVFVEARENAIVNRLNKTVIEFVSQRLLTVQRIEKQVDFRAEKVEHERIKTKNEKERLREERAAADEIARQRKAEAALRSYDRVFTEEAMRHSNNQDRDEQDEFDFM